MKYWLINNYLVQGSTAAVALRRYAESGFKIRVGQQRYISIKEISKEEYIELSKED